MRDRASFPHLPPPHWLKTTVGRGRGKARQGKARKGNMTEVERVAIEAKIKEIGLNSGKVFKSGGMWYVAAEVKSVAPPETHLPHTGHGPCVIDMEPIGN